MASGFVTAASLDLDSVFALLQTGWPQAAATEFIASNNADLNTRYAILSAGSAAAATSFFDAADNDLNTVFAAAGSTGVQVATQPSAISGSAFAPSGTVTSDTTTCAGTKGGGSYTYTWHIANGSGFSFTAPNSQTTAVTGTIPGNQTVQGGIYCTISDGVTSVNTNTVSCSLTNTYVNVSVATQPSAVSGSRNAGYPSGTVTSAAASCAGANGTGSYTYTWTASGCTATDPTSASTTFYATVSSSSTDNASAYCTISDGYTSVRTNTIAVTLTNTYVNVSVATQPSAVSGSSAAGNPSGAVTSDTTTVAGAGGNGSYTYTVTIASGSATATAPSSATSAVTNGAVPANTTISGTMYWTISDGSTSVNTNTVGWSLTNTTPASYTCDFEITAATTEDEQAGFGDNSVSGTFGTLDSVSGLPSSATLTGVYTQDIGGDYYQYLAINVASNPGQDSLTTFTFNGLDESGSTAESYTYSGEVAYWRWSISSDQALNGGSEYSGSAVFTDAI